MTTAVFSTPRKRLYFIDSIGRGGAIRTPDPLRPRQVRYQAALRPDISTFLILGHLLSFRKFRVVSTSLVVRNNSICHQAASFFRPYSWCKPPRTRVHVTPYPLGN